MKKQVLGAAALFASMMLATSAGAVTVFSDDFEDNDDSDWVFSTNYGAGVSGFDPATNGFLGTFIDAPPGGNDLIARGTRTLTLLAGNYTLDLDALSVPCSGCVISYDIIFDGNLLLRDPSFGAVEHRSFNLGALAAGNHTITLGMHTTTAQSGHFQATFDNVVLDGSDLVQPNPVPEPATWAMMLTGFFGAGALIRRRKAIAA